MDEYTKGVFRAEKFMGERGEDFELWTTWLIAMLEGRDLSGVVNGTGKPPSSEYSPEYNAYATKVTKARAILVNALGDKTLRVVQLCHIPKDITTKIWERYAEKQLLTRYLCSHR